MIWFLLVGLLCFPGGGFGKCQTRKARDCLTSKEKTKLLVADNFNGVIDTGGRLNLKNGCIVFVQKNGENQMLKKVWPQMRKKDDAYELLISKWHVQMKLDLFVLQGLHCNTTVSSTTGNDMAMCAFNHTIEGLCQVRCVRTEICDQSRYDAYYCNKMAPPLKDKYIINITATNQECVKCDNPIKEPEVEIDFPGENEGEISATQAAGIMNKMADLASSMHGSSAAVTAGEGITGILVKEEEPADVDEIICAYQNANDSIYIVHREAQAQFSRSVMVPKEAFQKAVSFNFTVPFAAVFRFSNVFKDEPNSTILGNEVLAVDLGTHISNLTDKLFVNFFNLKYEGVPSCRSWNGEGNQPNWTDDGCETITHGNNITCQCRHLTFFAILLAPFNETISSSDLNSLTIITQVGLGLSMFFLGVVLFMHVILRRNKASKATTLLVHLVSAMFLLNFTFLINNFVAELKSPAACKVMAALMHYFMLATFTWFAVQAFHLCLQLYTGGNILISRYVLKVSVASWVLPSVIVIVLLVVGKYGEQVIHTDDPGDNVAMCWITDGVVHHTVNFGYYALVFLFTFTTFIIMVSWLSCLWRTSTVNGQSSISGKRIATILGLCCMLGITWGFAFFTFSTIQVHANYIFTALNSFQGFFLFIYYHTSHSRELPGAEDGSKNTSSNAGTLVTRLDNPKNPYVNQPTKSM